jgi:hypothetical protein
MCPFLSSAAVKSFKVFVCDKACSERTREGEKVRIFIFIEDIVTRLEICVYIFVLQIFYMLVLGLEEESFTFTW